MKSRMMLFVMALLAAVTTTACGTAAEPQYTFETDPETVLDDAQATATAIIEAAQTEAETLAAAPQTDLADQAAELADAIDDAEADQMVPEETVIIQAEPTTAPIEPTPVPVEPTAVPVEPTPVPVEPTAMPVEPTDVPVEPTDVPVEPTPVPVEPTEVVEEMADVVEEAAEEAEEAPADEEAVEEAVEEAEDTVASIPTITRQAEDITVDFEPIPAEADDLALFVDLANPANGETLFNQTFTTSSGGWACTNCHNIDNDEVKIGPSLWGVPQRANLRVEGEGPYTYLFNSINNSQAYIVPGYEAGTLMPHYGAVDGSPEVLTTSQIYDLVAYLMTLDRPTP